MQTKLLTALLASQSLIANAVAKHGDDCDLECLSYCAYYYPSNSCVESCMCPQYALQGVYADETLRMHQLAKQATSALNANEDESEDHQVNE